MTYSIGGDFYEVLNRARTLPSGDRQMALKFCVDYGWP